MFKMLFYTVSVIRDLCVFVCLCREIEYKDLLLSQDQSRAIKPALSYKSPLTSSQDSRKQLKTKAVKIKARLKMSPYPQV